jgi:hypothetical protein
MTNEQINIAIAVLRGWRFVEDDPDYEPYWEDPNGTKIAVNFIEHRVPNCAGCLNAMHEAEKVLNENDQYFYWHFLYKMCGGSQEFDLLHATARQRAEAFLRTLGKWEEKA